MTWNRGFVQIGVVLAMALLFPLSSVFGQHAADPYLGRLSTGNTFSTSYLLNTSDSMHLHSPKTATIMSAIIPGLGQAYNRKYWKIGIIYGGFTGLAIGYKINNDSMKRYQQALNYRVDGDTNTKDVFYPLLSDNKVKQERNYYRSNRDRIILGIVALYALQIIDANVDAHLREFEINPELSMRVVPHMNYMPQTGIRPSLSLTFLF